MAKKANNSPNKLVGIGGWLVFPMIFIFYSLIVFIYDFVVSIESSFNYISLWDLVLIVLIIICLISIFNKKRYAPKLMILFYIAIILNGLLILILYGRYNILVDSSIASIIWIFYFNTSKRVKNTFTN